MGKIEHFEIIFFKSNAIYIGGEILSGVVNIKANDQVKVNSIFISISGTGQLKWLEKDVIIHGNNRTRSNITYENQESYFYKQVKLAAKENNSDLYIQSGENKFNFEIQLPENLPTSFQHKIGRIRYHVRGTIDIPWAIDKHTEKNFSIINHNDLNLHPELKQAVGATGQKTLCCGPCKSDPIDASFNLKKAGFVSGENMAFEAFIDNRSNKPLKILCIKLIQQTKFLGVSKLFGKDNEARTKIKIENREVASLTYPEKIDANEAETWSGALKIPAICSSTNIQNNLCKIIITSYIVRLHFDFKTLDISTDLTIPITIGTIPFKGMSRVKEESEDSDGDTELPMPSLPSLTYEPDIYTNDSSGITKGLERDAGDMIKTDEHSFKPLYPYYSYD